MLLRAVLKRDRYYVSSWLLNCPCDDKTMTYFATYQKTTRNLSGATELQETEVERHAINSKQGTAWSLMQMFKSNHLIQHLTCLSSALTFSLFYDLLLPHRAEQPAGPSAQLESCASMLINLQQILVWNRFIDSKFSIYYLCHHVPHCLQNS